MAAKWLAPAGCLYKPYDMPLIRVTYGLQEVKDIKYRVESLFVHLHSMLNANVQPIAFPHISNDYCTQPLNLCIIIHNVHVTCKGLGSRCLGSCARCTSRTRLEGTVSLTGDPRAVQQRKTGMKMQTDRREDARSDSETDSTETTVLWSLLSLDRSSAFQRQ